MRILWMSLAALTLAGCNKDKDASDDTGDTEDSGDTGESGDTGDTADTNVDCTVAVTSTEPESGEVDVYYHDRFFVGFDGDASGAEIEILDPSGAPVPRDLTWADGNVGATIDAILEPSTSYTLHVEVCSVTTVVPFTTSTLGTPLEGGTASLVGHTFMMQLSEADITEPGLLDALASQYLTVPLLFEVTQADDSTIDLLGALGYQESDGSYAQYQDIATWDFPAGDFTQSPYFYAAAEYIVIMYGSIAIPIENFTLEGTFTSDGSMIQEGRATGKADSRYMAPLIKQEDPRAFCDLAESLGIQCEACSDGGEYCMYIVAEEISATYQPGLDLVEFLPE